MFNPLLLKPRKRISGVLELDPAELNSIGIKAIIFDADNTLFPHGSSKASKEIQDKLLNLQKDFFIGLITNSSSRKRRRQLMEYFGSNGIEFFVAMGLTRKPFSPQFKEAIEHFQLEPKQIAMVGDNLFTDILGANNAGLFSIKIPAIDPKSEPFYFGLMRFLEGIVLLLL